MTDADDITNPLPRSDFELLATVRRIDKKLYGMRLWRKSPTSKEPSYIGHMIFRDDEWAQMVPGLRAADVLIEYLE